MSSTPAAQVPPEVDATLARLTANKNVKGVMILRRPLGIILRTAGPLFPPSPSSTHATTSSEADDKDSTEPNGTAHSTNDQLALSYARLGHNLVENVGEEVKAVDQGDDLKFLRIRTRKHEIMVTPDAEFILIVVQDPTS